METQYVILSKSVFKQVAAFKGLSTTINRLVSSANRLTLHPVSLTVSFTNRKNNKGSKIDLRGTPALM